MRSLSCQPLRNRHRVPAHAFMVCLSLLCLLPVPSGALSDRGAPAALMGFIPDPSGSRPRQTMLIGRQLAHHGDGPTTPAIPTDKPNPVSPAERVSQRKSTGNDAAGEPLNEKARSILRRIPGQNRLDFAVDTSNLAHLFSVVGRYSEAESLCGESLMNYRDSLETFKKIKEGMGQQEVRTLLGVPDRVTRGDSDQSWYDESWTYDLRKLPGYPREHALRAVWEGTIMFLNREVVHTRMTGWLE